MKRLRRIEPALRRALRGECALPPGSRVLVAASGGADSTALLVGLRRIAGEFGLEVSAAHLHHGLRGADADADMEHVRSLAAALDVPLIAARWDTRRRMRARGLAGEHGLRVLRREFLARVARRIGAAAIATGHTADDQLETVLMRLARGAGIEGLGGMRPRRGRWIKPLLEATRHDVERDLAAAGLGWQLDRTNLERTHLRNRIRLDVIPALVRAAHPEGGSRGERAGLARRAAESAREARDAGAALGRLTLPALRRLSRIQDGEIGLDSRGVAPYPIAARRTMLRRLWRVIPGPNPGLTRRHVELLDRLIVADREGARVELPGGWTARRDRGWIRFDRQRVPHRLNRGTR